MICPQCYSQFNKYIQACSHFEKDVVLSREKGEEGNVVTHYTSEVTYKCPLGHLWNKDSPFILLTPALEH